MWAVRLSDVSGLLAPPQLSICRHSFEWAVNGRKPTNMKRNDALDENYRPTAEIQIHRLPTCGRDMQPERGLQ